MRRGNQASTDDGDVPRGENEEQERPNYRVSSYSRLPHPVTTGWLLPRRISGGGTVRDAEDSLSIRWCSRCLNASGWPGRRACDRQTLMPTARASVDTDAAMRRHPHPSGSEQGRWPSRSAYPGCLCSSASRPGSGIGSGDLRCTPRTVWLRNCSGPCDRPAGPSRPSCKEPSHAEYPPDPADRR